MRVIKDDTKTEDAIPYWKIDDFLGFPGFSWVWVVLRAPRAKKVETKRFYYLLAKIGADTAENERNFAENLQLPYGSASTAVDPSPGGGRRRPSRRPDPAALPEARTLRRHGPERVRVD